MLGFRCFSISEIGTVTMTEVFQRVRVVDGEHGIVSVVFIPRADYGEKRPDRLFVDNSPISEHSNLAFEPRSVESELM